MDSEQEAGDFKKGPRLVITPSHVHFTIGSSLAINVGNIGDAEVGPLTVKLTGPAAANYTIARTNCDFLAPVTYCTIFVEFHLTPYENISDFNAILEVIGPAPDFVSIAASLQAGPLGPPSLR